MSKRKCSFSDTLQKEFSFLKKSAISTNHVFCNLCSVDFSIGTGGKSHILSHIKSERHKRAASRITPTQQSLTSFIHTGTTLSEKSSLLAAAEGTFAYHNVQHNCSFRLMDCTTKILKKVFDPAFSCARTKCEAIIVNVFGNYSIRELKDDIANLNFVSIYIDASNHGSKKLFPIMLRYFCLEKGIKVKLLEFQSKPGETAELITNYLMETINAYNLQKKVICFCADNANTNFGGCSRKGTNNIHTKLQNELSKNIIGIGCSAHILNNTIQTAADGLQFDIESILIKIFSYFHINTVRVEELKDYCNYVDNEYSQILGYSKTRWLSLLPAVSRLREMFLPLKVYFLSQKHCPYILKMFFEDESAEAVLCFVQKQASLFHSAVKEVEGQNVTVIKVSAVFSSLLLKLENRLNEKFISNDVLNMLKDSAMKDEVLEHFFTFYHTAIEYLRKWTVPFRDFIKFQWMSLLEVPDWKNILECYDFLAQNITVDDSALFDEFSLLKIYLQDKISIWNSQNISIDGRWLDVISHFKKSGVSVDNFSKIAEFILCLPASNAPTERVFSIMNNIWTPEKNSLHPATLKSLLITKVNLEYTCTEFYNKLLNDKQMLIDIQSSNKYGVQ